MGNRQRIIDETLRLMNERGAQAIGTTQITDELGISPGNLYYHFKNKEEIVRALFADLDCDIRQVFESAGTRAIEPKLLASFFVGTFDVAWRYRFFFGGLLHLLRRDELFAEGYRELQDWTKLKIETVCQQMAKEGVLNKPKGRLGFRILATNLWILWSNWIRHSQISNENNEVNKSDIDAGVRQLFELMSPHLDDKYDKAVRRVMSKEIASTD